MSHPIQNIGGLATPPINENVYPILDDVTAVWVEDDGTTTSTLYDHVDDTNSTDYIRLNNSNLIISVCPTDEVKNLRFLLDEPSADPGTVNQSAVLNIRAYIDDPFTTGFTATVDITLDEGSSPVQSDTGNTLTTTVGTDSLVLSQANINSVSDWSNVYAEFRFEVCADGVDANLNIHVESIWLDFS